MLSKWKVNVLESVYQEIKAKLSRKKLPTLLKEYFGQNILQLTCKKNLENLKIYSRGKYVHEFKFILSMFYCILPHALCDVHSAVSTMEWLAAWPGQGPFYSQGPCLTRCANNWIFIIFVFSFYFFLTRPIDLHSEKRQIWLPYTQCYEPWTICFICDNDQCLSLFLAL